MQGIEALDEGGGIAPVKDDFDRVGHASPLCCTGGSARDPLTGDPPGRLTGRTISVFMQ